MSYDFLSKAEQDEMYDLKVIVNHLTCGLLDIVALNSVRFSIERDPYSVHWFVERIHQLREKNDMLMKMDMLHDLELIRDAVVVHRKLGL